MSRYLELAEYTARLLDTCFYLDMDLRGVPSGPRWLRWTSLGMPSCSRLCRQLRWAGGRREALMIHWLAFDTENPNSILSCNQSGRIQRPQHSQHHQFPVLWKAAPTSSTGSSRIGNSSGRGASRRTSIMKPWNTAASLFQGACDATLDQDEGWRFIQMGKYLERTDITVLRILDIQYYLLRDAIAVQPINRWPTCTEQGVLRSCRSLCQAYQRFYVGRVEPVQVVVRL